MNFHYEFQAGLKLYELDVKPTFACNAKCKFCLPRRQLYQGVNKKKILSIDQWRKILSDARKLGATSLIISGGEPTLYHHLVDLIRAGKKQRMHICLNTNGSTLTDPLARELLGAGVNAMRLSIYSPRAATHDEIRGVPGLWEKATRGMRILSSLKKKYRSFQIFGQCVICRQNREDFPELIEMFYLLGADAISISYLEGDFEKKDLLTEEEIRDFKSRIIPRGLDFCGRLKPALREMAQNALQNLYGEHIASLNDFAKGVYRSSDRNPNPCGIPRRQALILSNGDVLPCNMIEYCHNPTVGNLFKHSLAEIWQGEAWQNFRRIPFEYCPLCPMNLHTELVLRRQDSPLWKRALKQIVPPALIRLARQKPARCLV